MQMDKQKDHGHYPLYDEMRSLRLVNTPRKYKVMRNWLLGIFAALLACLFLPWQQNVQGKGVLTPFRPQDRPQVIPSVIAGRIDRWLVQEGQLVHKGDTICIISEVKEKYFDPKLLDRTQDQIRNKEDAVKAKYDKIGATERQVKALKEGLRFKLQQARNKVKQVQYKVAAERASLDASRVQAKLVQDQYERLETLHRKGLASLTELQNRNAKTQEASAKLVEAENKFNLAQNEMVNAEIELNALEADYVDKISKAESVINETSGDLLESQAEISKMKIELSNLSLRSGFYIIRAPQDGYVVKALKSGIGELVKEGDEIVTIVPSDVKLAVALYVRTMDLPLMHEGVKVRLQFDGWPALVFSGWPNVGAGTFGGTIQVVDRMNSENGYYRVLVVPDPDDRPWPNLLRAGGGVYGWAMLNRVRVGYELWRQFNGFPPEFVTPETSAESKKK